MTILGTRVLRTEDHAFLTTGATYSADLRDPLLDGAAHVTFVRSPIAHGRISSIEVDDARALPGVLAVLTAADLDLEGPSPLDVPGLTPEAMVRPWLATDVVRFVGEPFAIVVTERADQAEDAAELVWADIEPLPVVVDPRDAARDEVLLFPEAGTNTSARMGSAGGDELFEGCEVVVRAELRNQRLAACPLEGRAAAAAWHDGGCTVWISNQSVHNAHRRYQAIYGLAADQVRVVTPDVGGGFGPKIHTYPEELLIPWVARHVERPVRWVEARSENMVAMGHGRGHLQSVEIGGRRDGTIEAYRLTTLADGGAYPALGTFLPTFSCKMATGTYAIGRVEAVAQVVVTNTMSTVAYRGAGRPEATAAIERAVDLFAAEIGADPAAVRRQNLIPADAFPYDTPTGATYDSGDYVGALDRALGAAGYDELRSEQARRRAAGDVVQLGIGVSTYVEITAGPVAGRENGSVQVRPDGTVRVLTGSSAHGQGHHTAFAMLVAEATGIDMGAIEVVHGDTALIPRGVGTFGSRSLQLGGAAVHEATGLAVDAGRAVAADLLGVDATEVELDTSCGCFFAGADRTDGRTWAEVAAAADPERGIIEETAFAGGFPTYPFGAHVAVVEVDTETGGVRHVRHVACDDAGTILNPMLAEGQRHGGIAQGAAQVLTEAFLYDDDGNPLTSTFADYGIISSAELPSFELVGMETPTTANPLGAKGVGESGTIGATPAVHSAVIDALGHLGVRHLDMPATPQRVWQAICDAQASST